MRATLTIICCLLFVEFALCQKITTVELIEYTKCKDLDCFKSWISTKGFVYLKSNNTDDKTEHLFMTKEKLMSSSNNDVSVENEAIFSIYKNNKISIIFRTVDNNTFQKLINEFTGNKFYSLNKGTEENGIWKNRYFSYERKDLEILCKIEKRSSGDQKYTSYQVEIRHVM